MEDIVWNFSTSDFGDVVAPTSIRLTSRLQNTLPLPVQNIFPSLFRHVRLSSTTGTAAGLGEQQRKQEQWRAQSVRANKVIHRIQTPAKNVAVYHQIRYHQPVGGVKGVWTCRLGR